MACADIRFESNKYNFKKYLEQYNLKIQPLSIDILQANITLKCNQACAHCHVNASPQRTEKMDLNTINQCLEILSVHEKIDTLDLTGGAPELNPDFDYFVIEAKKIGKKVLVRHNLTVTFDGNPGTGESKSYLPEFFASQKVEIVSSFPYYQKYFTDKQRGSGVFEKSIESLRLLNKQGFGQENTGLVLNLVYNPAGAFLPASQDALEQDFKKELESKYNIVFNNLFTITNMPIFRFRDQLKKLNSLDEYMQKLVNAFNPVAAEGVMCRNQISVGYDGTLFDCDFNQMLGLQVELLDKPMTVFNFDYEKLINREIIVAPHCFGCTAGGGSSCGGATA